MAQKQTEIHRELVEACRDHDRTAQIKIYELYYHAMYNTSYRIVNDPMEAEEAMQDAFLDAFRKIDTFHEESSFGTWLKRIVVNKSLDLVRKRKNTLSLEESIKEIADTSEDELVDEELIQYRIREIADAMDKLPDNYRIILSLYLLEGYDHQEISEILKISYNNTRIRYLRAKQRLLQEISGPKQNIPDFQKN